jgi:hypothetical protein
MLFLKLWTFVKKYWKILALIVGAIVGFVLFQKQKTSFADDLKAINDAHDAEMKAIEAARAEEARKNAENSARLEAALVAVQKQYDEQKRALDAKKKAEIEQIVKDYGDDPNALAKKLSEVTGFVIVLPD